MIEYDDEYLNIIFGIHLTRIKTERLYIIALNLLSSDRSNQYSKAETIPANIGDSTTNVVVMK